MFQDFGPGGVDARANGESEENKEALEM